MPSEPLTTLRHDSVTFDDGHGHNWHVPFSDIIGVPRVGDKVSLPDPPGANKVYSVVSVEHQFIQQDVPDGTTGVSVGGNEKWMYASPTDVIVKIRPSRS
jgi:hypothetical protein